MAACYGSEGVLKIESPLVLAKRSWSVLAPDATVRANLERYLQAAGYIQEPGQHLVYRRGTLLGSLTSDSPRSWSVSLLLEVHQTEPEQCGVDLLLQADEADRRPGPAERAFFDAEIAGLMRASRTGEVELKDATRAERSAKFASVRKSWLRWLIVVSTSVLCAVLVSAVTGDRTMRWLGLAAGFIVGGLVAQRLVSDG